MRLWDLWDPQPSNISRFPKPYNFRTPTLEYGFRTPTLVVMMPLWSCRFITTRLAAVEYLNEVMKYNDSLD